ncbi:hypothetical protein [Chromobacterium violaceum]|uniref:hypothetical protein n=1 Tax=Chromobacterium violaceum TaxID=536 RepID=UPI0012D41D9D|nr:hypothetical protein [Chromobacterium violaceum]MBP4045075.1 hypothetical protein [Chromobacterium violaceum]
MRNPASLKAGLFSNGRPFASLNKACHAAGPAFCWGLSDWSDMDGRQISRHARAVCFSRGDDATPLGFHAWQARHDAEAASSFGGKGCGAGEENRQERHAAILDGAGVMGDMLIHHWEGK